MHLHSVGRWVLSGADAQDPWHGVLEAVRLFCDEAQQVGCLRGLEGCPLLWDVDIQTQFARCRWFVGLRINQTDMSTAAPEGNAVLCYGMGQG